MTKLKEVCKIEKGKIGITKATEGKYPLVVTAEERASHNEWHFNKPATIIPLVSSTGHGHASMKRLHYEEGKFAVGNILAVLTPNDKAELNAKFLYLYLTANKEKLLVSQMTGAANVSLTLTKLKDVEIEIPSMQEQMQIVSKYQSVVEKKKKMIATLNKQNKHLNRILANEFNEILPQVDYFEMGEVAPIVRRSVKILNSKEYPELGIRSFGKGTFLKPSIIGKDLGSKKIYEIHKGDLLFSNVFAWEGAIAVVGDKGHRRYGSHRFISCVCDPDTVLPEFLHYYFLSDEGMNKIRKASPGSTSRNKTLGLKKLENIEVPIPDFKVQQEFVTLKKKVNSLINNNNRNVKNLDLLSKALLNEIFEKEND